MLVPAIYYRVARLGQPNGHDLPGTGRFGSLFRFWEREGTRPRSGQRSQLLRLAPFVFSTGCNCGGHFLIEWEVSENFLRRVRLLVVHSDEELVAQLRRGLRAQAYEVRTATHLHSALDLIRSWAAEVVLSEFAGETEAFRNFQRRLKSAAGSQLIAVLGNRPGKLRMAALRAGADDYVACPITIPELTARIALATERALSLPATRRQIETADLRIDLEQRRVIACGQERHLPAKQFELLRCLVVNAERPVQHRDLIAVLGNHDGSAGKNALRVYIRELRKKLEPDPGRPRYIRTVARIGYRFDAGTAHDSFLMSA